MKSQPTIIPPALRSMLSIKAFYAVCALSVIPGHTCQGEINWEHAVIFNGKKVQEEWAIVPICEGSHNTGIYQDSGTMNKELHVWIALSRATEADLKRMTGETMYRTVTPFLKVVPWLKSKEALIKRYGTFSESEAIKRYIPAPREARVSASRIAPFTLELKKEHKKMVQDCIDFYDTQFDMKFTPYLMVDKMIRAAHEAMLETKKLIEERNKSKLETGNN